MKSKPKPDLTLIRGDKAQEPDAIIMLFERLMGRKATVQEIAEVRNFKHQLKSTK
jgi:hypothetical protein